MSSTVASSPAITSLPATRPRTTWIDSVRGLGIFLVVVGHTLRGLSASGLLPDTAPWPFLDRFIYAFHMPLFFLVTGLFLLPASDESFLDFARRRLVRLGYPYLLWASLQTLSQVLLSRYTNHAMGLHDLLAIGYQPPMQFWFLYALLLQTLFLGMLAKLGLGRGTILALAVLIFLGIPYLPIGTWSPLNQARNYLIYTAIGVFLGAPQRIGSVQASSTPWTFTFNAVFGFWLVGFAVFDREIAVGDRFWGFALACVGIVASVCLCVRLSELQSRAAQSCSALLVSWGEASMAIFVAHTLASAAIRIGLVKALHVEDVTVHLLLGASAGIGVPWALFLLSKRYHVPYLFEWPTRPRTRPSRPSMESSAT